MGFTLVYILWTRVAMFDYINEIFVYLKIVFPFCGQDEIIVLIWIYVLCCHLLMQAVTNNEKSMKAYTADVAEFDLVMQVSNSYSLNGNNFGGLVIIINNSLQTYLIDLLLTCNTLGLDQTTKAGTHDSESCLKEGACLPLGGYRWGFMFW